MRLTQATTKEEFFPRPSTVRDILAGKEIINVSTVEGDGHPDQLASIIQNLSQQTQGVLVKEHIIPQEYEDSQNYLKRGPLVHLRHRFTTDTEQGRKTSFRMPRSLEEVIREQLSPSSLINETFSVLNPDSLYAGMRWNNPRTKAAHIVHLTDILEGAKLYAFSEVALNQRRQDMKMRVTHYTTIMSADVGKHGGKFMVNYIPSRSTPRKYRITVESFPMPRTRQWYAVWMCMKTTEHACMVRNTDFTYRFTTPPVIYCAHDIAAVYKIIKDMIELRWHEEKNRGIQKGTTQHIPAREFVELNPFGVPSQDLVDYWNKLRNNVMIQYTDAKGHNKRRKLNKGEIEILLWKYVAANPHKSHLSTDTNIKLYNW